MDKAIAQLRAIVAAILAWPVIAPLLQALRRKRTITLLVGLISFYGIAFIPGLSETMAERLSNFVFYGTLILTGSFTIEGLLNARGTLPTTIEELVRAIVAELLMPTPETQTSVTATTTATTVSLTPAPIVGDPDATA